MTPIIQIALGGALGSVLRYGLGIQAARMFGTGFPVGTMTSNLLGSLVMGLVVGGLGARFGAAPFVMVGLLGGFTTFSTFSLDAVGLIERGQVMLATLYIGGSVIGGIGGLVLGLALGRSLGA